MATFIEQATQQLSPLYQQQEQALTGQIPAIQNLFNTLIQGLEGQRQTETQNILESASARGVLRSSLPVDLQTQLGQALLGERAKLEAGRAEQIGGIQSNLAKLGLQKTQSIFDLASALENQDLKRQDFIFQQSLAKQKAKSGSGRQPTASQLRSAAVGAARQIFSSGKGLGDIRPSYGETERDVIPFLMEEYGLSFGDAAAAAYAARKPFEK